MAAERHLASASPSLLLAARLTGNGITGFWNCNARIVAAHNGEFRCYSFRCRMIGKRNASPRRLAAVANRPAAYAPQKGSRGRSPGSEWRRSRVYFSIARWSGRSTKKKPSPESFSGLGSGDVLLSHDLSLHYHRGCSVSLPCSEWERVVPLRYYHQRRELMVES